MNRDNFKWTDELVKDYATQCAVDAVFNTTRRISIEDFKASHTSAIEEREGRDWEIVEFKKGDDQILKWSNGKYRNELNSIGLENCLSMNLPIHSVLRKSDGVVLSIGDQTKWGPIKEFKIKGHWMAARFEYEDVGCEIPINEIQPLPQRTKPPLGPLSREVEKLEERIAYIEKKLNIEG